MPTGTKDYYELLGCEKTASADEIKKAFRRKARELHPDVNSAADAEERFKEVNAAYDVLSDPAKREQYDRFGAVGPNGGGFGGFGGNGGMGDFFGGGVSMEDLFSTFFGGIGGMGGGRGVRLEGRNMGMTLTITLAEAAAGLDREIVVDRLVPCDACGATGAAEGSEATTCPECRGSGQRVSVRQTFLGAMQTAVPCERCGATGKIIENACEECEGSGRVPDREHLTIHIQPGIQDGQQVGLRGKGEAGIRGAAAGDLIVTVRIKQDEYLHRERDDLHCLATVSVTQAILGDTIELHGVLEDVSVEVPAGTQDGHKIRVRGKGMPRYGGLGRGDLMVHVNIDIPKKLTKRQRELVEELAQEFGEETREQPKTPLQKLKDWLGA